MYFFKESPFFSSPLLVKLALLVACRIGQIWQGRPLAKEVQVSRKHEPDFWIGSLLRGIEILHRCSQWSNDLLIEYKFAFAILRIEKVNFIKITDYIK